MAGDLKFHACDMFVTKEEVLYFSNQRKKRILRLSPGESQPIIVGRSQRSMGRFWRGCLWKKVGRYTLRTLGPGSYGALIQVTQAAMKFLDGEAPIRVLVHGRSLYGSTSHKECGAVYEYVLPPELNLCRNSSFDLFPPPKQVGKSTPSWGA